MDLPTPIAPRDREPPRSPSLPGIAPPRPGVRSPALLAALLGALLGAAPAAAAQESVYCRKVRARAVGDAALLFAPSLQAQVLKFPRTGAIDPTTMTVLPSGGTPASLWQGRAGLAFSAVDFYKGFRVLRVADADCRAHDAEEQAQQLLLQGDDAGRLEALDRQAAYLAGQRAAWERIVAESDRRVAEQITTLVDARDVHSRRAQLERKALQVAQDLQRLRSRGLATPAAPPARLAHDVEETALGFEREASHVRTLDAWTLTVTGGVVPTDGVDTFGIVSLGINLGAPLRYTREARYLEERAAELRAARYEVPDQVRRLQGQLAGARDLARRELAVVEAELASLQSTRAVLVRADARTVPHSLAVVELDLIAIEADRVYLTALIDALDRLAGPTPTPTERG